MKSNMRRYAVLALLAWITGWASLVLQPCCETIAEASPHEHELSANTHDDDHGSNDAEHPLQTANLGHEHEQCLNELPTGQELDNLVTLKQSRDLETKFASLPLLPASDLISTPVSDRQYNFPQEIPPLQILYHRTQRLRI